MKRDDKKVMSFRFSDHILNKIDYLEEEDRENAEKLGIKSKTRKQIIEECIQDYYFRKINNDRDPDTMDRISIMVNDAADVRFGMMKRVLDEILFLAIKHDIGNKLFFRSNNILPNCPEKSEAVSIFAEESKWDNALQEYMSQRWGRIVADIHHSRRPPR